MIQKKKRHKTKVINKAKVVFCRDSSGKIKRKGEGEEDRKEGGKEEEKKRECKQITKRKNLKSKITGDAIIKKYKRILGTTLLILKFQIEMGKFLEKKYNLPRRNQEEIINLNRCITIKSLKSFPTKKTPGPEIFTGDSIRYLKNKNSNLTRTQRIEKESTAELIFIGLA